MNKSIPVRFLRDATLLLEVPQSEYLDRPVCENPLDKESRHNFFKMLRGKLKDSPKTPHFDPRKKHIREFHTAVWLSFRNPPNKPVALLLSYKDSTGEFAIIVDESTPDVSSTMMLAGDCRIEFQGELKYLKALATGLKREHLFFVEDVHVQRIKQAKDNPDDESLDLASGR